LNARTIVKRNAFVPIVLTLWLGCGGGQSSSDKPTAPASAAAEEERGKVAGPAPTGRAPAANGDLPVELQQAATDLRVTQALVAFKGLADEMCACLSPQCASGVETKIESLGERFSDLEGNDFSEAQQQELMLAAIRMAQCQAQLLAQSESS
jgi:hypothetical protein